MKSRPARRALHLIAPAALIITACEAALAPQDTAAPRTTWVADAASGRVYKIGEACAAVVSTSPDLGRPSAVVFDSYRGYCWVADADGGRVFRLTPRGVLEKTLYGFGEPVALALCPKENAVWVADRAGGKIYKLTERGTVRAELGGLAAPAAVAVDATTGEVYVACARSVVRCDRWAQPIETFYGFSDPRALAFDNGLGFLWVADTGNGRVVKVKRYGEIAAESRALEVPVAIAVNPRTGFCFAADTEHGKIVSLKGDGSTRWTNGDYTRPTALAANPSDMSLWVADADRFEVAKLHGSTGKAGDYNSLAGFADPVALYTDPGIR
jgi:DNA-binding beta-propeller fold protein YncE